MRTAIYITNRLATQSLHEKTPIKALSTNISQLEVLNLSHLRTIRCKAYYYLAKEQRKNGAKFKDRAKQGILIRYEGNSIYRIYDRDRGIVWASAVVFDENDAPIFNENDALDLEVPLNDLLDETHDTHARGATQNEDGT